MELDEMKLAWQAMDRRLEQRFALDLAAYRDRRLATARRQLWPLWLGQVLQLVIGIALAWWAGSLWYEHRATLHLWLQGVLLHGYALMFIVLAARELHLIHSVDYAEPVLVIQRRLAQLRAWRIRVAPWFGIAGCVMWVPLLLVGVEAAFGADLVLHAPQVVAFLAANGAACLLGLLAFLRWTRHPRGARLAASLDQHAAGRSLRRAQAELDEILRFEQDGG